MLPGRPVRRRLEFEAEIQEEERLLAADELRRLEKMKQVTLALERAEEWARQWEEEGQRCETEGKMFQQKKRNRGVFRKLVARWAAPLDHYNRSGPGRRSRGGPCRWRQEREGGPR